MGFSAWGVSENLRGKPLKLDPIVSFGLFAILGPNSLGVWMTERLWVKDVLKWNSLDTILIGVVYLSISDLIPQGIVVVPQVVWIVYLAGVAIYIYT